MNINEIHGPIIIIDNREETINLRNKDNMLILKELADYFNRFPTLRFTQALNALGVDPTRDFYEEPSKTLNKIKNTSSIVD